LPDCLPRSADGSGPDRTSWKLQCFRLLYLLVVISSSSPNLLTRVANNGLLFGDDMPAVFESSSPHRTMLLTGASRGIGHATVRLFYESGWRVLTLSRAPFTSDCPWPGGQENHIQGDLSDTSSYVSLAEEIRRRLGGTGLYAIVNNAAVSPKLPGGARMDISHTQHEDWVSVFNVNLFGSFENGVGNGAHRACSLKREKSSFPAMRNRTVRMVSKRAYPRALRLAA
jgi:NAD(P)-dependent dehydrogenase (short-subunit alcohol dehydrogenase family)